jgi:hypothetical protein
VGLSAFGAPFGEMICETERSFLDREGGLRQSQCQAIQFAGELPGGGMVCVRPARLRHAIVGGVIQ